MLILQSPRTISHLRLINLSIYIHTCDLSYLGATLPVLIADLQGSMLCNWQEMMMAAVVACKDKKRTPRWIQEQNLESSFALSSFKSSAVCSNGSLLPPCGCLLSLKAGDQQWIIICACRCCWRDQFSNNGPSHVVQTEWLLRSCYLQNPSPCSLLPLSCQLSRSCFSGHRPPLTASPGPPCAAAQRGQLLAACSAHQAKQAASQPWSWPSPRADPPFPFHIHWGHEHRIDGSSCLASLLGHTFKEQISIWTLF